MQHTQKVGIQLRGFHPTLPSKESSLVHRAGGEVGVLVNPDKNQLIRLRQASPKLISKRNGYSTF